jgi:hypothetical protein
VAGGALAQWLAPSTVVGLAGVVGALSVALLLVAWPTELRSRFIVLPETPPAVPAQTGPRHRRTARATSG